jgi:hypothetical protein
MNKRVANTLPRVLFVLILLLVFLVPITGWSQTACGEATVSALIAGQNTTVGTVTIENDEQFLYVTYQTDGNWLITETHLDVAMRPEDLGQTPKGNAVPGRFTYQSVHEPPVATVVHAIDLSVWPANSQLYVAAHSVVVSANSSETAWGEGIDFPGANWAMYIPYLLKSCEPPPLNPGIIDMESSAIEVEESVVSLTLKLIRSSGSDGQVTVTLDSSDITAALFYDYELATYVVTFEDGETEKTFDIYIMDDLEEEIDEQFTVQIVSVTGAEMGSNTTTTVTIIDDDEGGNY